MKKSVSITFDSVTVVVEGETDKELLEKAKIAALEEMKQKMPPITYSINDYNEDALTVELAQPGTTVKTQNGKLGIITAINRKSINITLADGVPLQGPAIAFLKSDAAFEEARHKREDWDKPDWQEGHSAYFKNGKEIHEVVVGK